MGRVAVTGRVAVRGCPAPGPAGQDGGMSLLPGASGREPSGTRRVLGDPILLIACVVLGAVAATALVLTSADRTPSAAERRSGTRFPGGPAVTAPTASSATDPAV